MLSVLDFVAPLVGSDSFFVGTAIHPQHGPVLDYSVLQVGCHHVGDSKINLSGWLDIE